MEGDDAADKTKHLPHWTAEDIEKWEAGKEDREYRWRGAALEIQHHIEQYKQEWERRIGTRCLAIAMTSR